MLPKAHNSPAKPSQLSANVLIPCIVRRNLRLPVSHPALRHPAVPPATVPEAAVNKHGHTLARKSEIWLTWQPLVTTSAFDAVCTQN